MKTITYIITAIMISGILISAIPFNKNNKNVCISLKCTDAAISDSLMEASAKIIKNRLKDIGHKPSQLTIEDGGLIEICFKNESDLNEVSHILNSKGKFELYETVDRNDVLKKLQKDDKMFSALDIPEDKSEKTKFSNSVLGYYSESTILESNKYIESLNKGFSEDIKFALSKFKDKEKDLSLYLLKPKASLEGSSISDISKNKDKRSGQYYISMDFDDEGTKKWAEITRRNIGKEVAMVFDNQVYSAPLVMGIIEEGKCWITGHFSSDEVTLLWALIKNGELPLDFEMIK